MQRAHMAHSVNQQRQLSDSTLSGNAGRLRTHGIDIRGRGSSWTAADGRDSGRDSVRPDVHFRHITALDPPRSACQLRLGEGRPATMFASPAQLQGVHNPVGTSRRNLRQ